MNSENQQKVIAFLLEHKTASARQLAKVLGRDSMSAWKILAYMLRRGIITRTEQHKELTLTRNWESKVFRPKASTPKNSERPSITEVCRQNWQGHKIHQIFGSAKP